MSREIPFDKNAKCDYCGTVGAYDFMGDYICPNCALTAIHPEYFEDEDTNSTANANDTDATRGK